MGEASVMVLLHNLTQLLELQGNNLPGVEDQLRWIYNQFQVMLGFVRNDEKTGRWWFLVNVDDKIIKHIRKVAHDAEDFVDTYVSAVAKHRPPNTEGFAPVIDHIAELHTLRMRIKEIIQTIGESGYRHEYGLTRRRDVVKGSTPRGWAAEEYEPVGLAKECQTLVDRLIGEPRELEIFAITGEGGAGKTTLAMKLYSDVSVKKYFRSRGWMLVSKNYRLRNLLLSVLSDFMIVTEEIYEKDNWGLKQQLLKQLRGHRYLIVIDDVWDSNAWDELKHAFPQGKEGSRIILTTRFRHVASSATRNKKHLHQPILHQMLAYTRSREYGNFNLGSLNEQDSWELFSNNLSGDKKCPPEMEHLGRMIVGSCGGLPIVIVIVASILRARKMTVSSWFNMVKQFDLCRVGPYVSPSDVLTVCYHNLPQHLKPCFLYLSVFMEDYKISVKQLIQLWIAEGLIQYSVDSTERCMEDVAEDYLKELIDRNLIQETKRRSDRGPKSCRIHDIIRDLCINLSEGENFVEVYTGRGHSTQGNPRRLSILGNCREYISNSKPYISFHVLRSFSCFSHDTRSVLEKNWESFFKQSPLLRVLNLGEGEVGKLPETIKGLFHLRYLRLKPEENIRVPKSIFNLWNLQTLDLRTTRFPKLSEGIWKMQQLRHLYLDGPSRLPKAKSTEDCLPNLLTLSYISDDSNNGIDFSKKAPNLRKLGLYGYQCSKSEQRVTFNLEHLQSLKFAEKCVFKEPIKLPATVTKITMKSVYLQPNVIKMLGKQKNLQILKLVKTAFDDDELIFAENSFPELQLLKFEKSNIITWKLEKGALRKLQRLVFNNCSQLTEFPPQLWEVNTLQDLELFWASTTLANKLTGDLKKNKGLKHVIYPPLLLPKEKKINSPPHHASLLDASSKV